MTNWFRSAKKWLNNNMMQKMVEWYVTGKDTDDHKCGHCNMRIEKLDGTSECTVMEGSISLSTGTCSYWVFGKDSATEEDSHEAKMTQETAGYVEFDGKINCASCMQYESSEQYCKLWMGHAKEADCCTAWERSDNEVDTPFV